MIVVAAIDLIFAGSICAQTNNRLTPIQERLQAEERRLSGADVEERRDALMKLGAMNHSEASRVAASALKDPEPVVRVTAVHAIRALPSSEAASALLPLLQDKEEFVRREAAHALGRTGSRTAVQPLIQVLATDKEAGVRAAAALALGRIRDEAAVVPLANVLSAGEGRKKSKTAENEFVMRASAQALGQLHSQAGVATLIAILNDEKKPIDVRRAAADALGEIGDSTAMPALKAAASSSDPYLSQSARAALRRLH